MSQQLSFADIQPFNGLFLNLNPKIVAAFLEFHHRNPAVFQLFKQFAIEARGSGRRHYGAKAIMERIRWHIEVDTGGEFKINNSYVSGFVRLLIFYEPAFADFFEIRRTPGTILEVH